MFILSPGFERERVGLPAGRQGNGEINRSFYGKMKFGIAGILPTYYNKKKI